MATFLIAILTITIARSSAQMLQQDMDALLTFKLATDASNALDWSQSVDPCSWRGITCVAINASSQRVLKMNLPGRGLSGRIPQILGSLEELTALSLRNNRITGPLPSDIAKCRKLRSLALQGNSLQGEISWDFASWQMLARLDLSSNSLNGTIPESLGELPRLKYVFLNNNSFSGELPGLSFPERLASVSFAFNRFAGEVPESLASFPASDFSGNEGLCGDPLGVQCAVAPSPSPPNPPPRKSPPPSNENARDSRSGRRLGLGAILAIVIGDIAILAVLTTLFMFCYWHKQNKRLSKSMPKNKSSKASAAGNSSGGAGGDMYNSSSNEFKSSTSSSEVSSSAEAQAGKLSFLRTSSKNFLLEDLLKASAEMIGQGCLGTSYRAVLDDGQFVVVKRIKGIHLSSKEFEQRMALLGKTDHENVLFPRAYYYSKTEKLVVMDFVPKKSLALHLHGEDKESKVLDWQTRLWIALGTARGLAYLHQQQFIHGNIKSSNVLLGGSRKFQALVVDHGLIQMLAPDASISVSLAGYRAPEVSATRKFTQQSDVFAFGVLLLELLTGRPPWKTNSRGERIDLTRWVQSVVREEWTEEVFDQGILRFSEEEMVQMLQVALACVATLPSDRPRMQDIVRMIEEVRPTSSFPPDMGGTSYEDDTTEEMSSGNLVTQLQEGGSLPRDRSR